MCRPSGSRAAVRSSPGTVAPGPDAASPDGCRTAPPGHGSRRVVTVLLVLVLGLRPGDDGAGVEVEGGRDGVSVEGATAAGDAEGPVAVRRTVGARATAATATPARPSRAAPASSTLRAGRTRPGRRRASGRTRRDRGGGGAGGVTGARRPSRLARSASS